MPRLIPTAYEVRGPMSIYESVVVTGRPRRRILDRQDGWGAFFNAHGVGEPYTIYQLVDREIRWTTHEQGTRSDKAVFTEAWHSTTSGLVLDKFVVARFFRQADEGSLAIRADAWVVPGKQNLAAQGFSPSEDGSQPWGAAMGQDGLLPIPAGTVVLRHRFLATWRRVCRRLAQLGRRLEPVRCLTWVCPSFDPSSVNIHTSKSGQAE